ncbi:MAG: methylated-DNA--[protein]-cysteine S-methyltransferase [Candidatus Zixiibacteriota bacterium]
MLYYDILKIDAGVFLCDHLILIYNKLEMPIRTIWGNSIPDSLKSSEITMKPFDMNFIEQYLNANIPQNIKLDFDDDDFCQNNRPTRWQKTVWKETLKIPYGQAITYQELARKCNNPKASRAVGNALGKNPLPIIVPCHRIIGKKTLGGFSSPHGSRQKKALLDFEKRVLNSMIEKI